MSDLVVIAYEDEGTATQVRDKLETMQKEHIVGLEDLVLVVRSQDGKPKIKQSVNLAGAGALSGSFWGLLIGILFWMPWLGLAIGALSGAMAGHFTDIGIDDKFIKEVGATIKPGNSAVFMLIRESTPDKFVNALKEFGGTVLQTSLSEEDEAKLRAAFDEHQEEEA
ncbi:DUF1269 domain-containing protein [Chloroflexota bacterium]